MAADSDHLKSKLDLLEQVFQKNGYSKQEIMPILYNNGQKLMPNEDEKEIRTVSVLPLQADFSTCYIGLT